MCKNYNIVNIYMNEINISKPSRAQMNKMMKGGSVVVKAGEHPIYVNATTFKKMNKNFMKGKGCCMKMCHEEMEHNMKGDGLIGTFFNRMGNAIVETGKPYMKELAMAGIISAGTALSAFQPELAPFIIPGTLALSAVANQYIDDLGQPKSLPPIPEQNYNMPPSQYQYQPPPPVYYSQMHSVPNMTGLGLHSSKGRYSNHGMMSGGNLINGPNIHPALLSSNPEHLLNRNLRGSLHK